MWSISPLSTHPFDVYIWSSILIIGAIIFVLREIKLHKPNDMITNERKK